ncbi:MAG: preprotein translocase subunit SecE [Chromatiales bacterium]|jgi:preprotein translocase subunit SecE|nr:preprotein translocase subunit SecE [Chromatiales bacterium]
MSANVEVSGGVPDAIKWAVAIVLLAGSTAAFYYYADQSLLYRTIGLLVVAGVAIFVAGQTGKGREVYGFLRDARTEVRKVVWPTQTETLQTTGIVVACVFVIAIFLWILDSILGWAVKQLFDL